MYKPEEFLARLPLLVSSEQMGRLDKSAIDFGIPELVLMENASREALAIIASLETELAESSVWIFMGPGNNGGDAVCMARHLNAIGARVTVFHTRPLESYKNSCKHNLDLAIKDHLRLYFVQEGILPDSLLDRVDPPDIIIDGLLGTGFRGPLSPAMERMIDSLNCLAEKFKARMYAIDIPSGLDSRTGQPSPQAIRANATVTFAYAKPGLVYSGAYPYTGKVFVRDIGFPLTARRQTMPEMLLLDGRALLKPCHLPENGFKNIFGHVAIFGGANGMSGAPLLSALGAIKAGAGLVTVCAPHDAILPFQCALPEAMTRDLGQAWPAEPSSELLDFIRHCQAIVIGPGMGRTNAAYTFLKSILAIPNRPPAVIDADALACMASDTPLVDLLDPSDICTPHPGEAAMLLRSSGKAVQQDRLKALAALCDLSSSVFVLKGAASLIGQQSRIPIICPYDIPQLAIAGAGDVLAGIIGGLRAQAPASDPQAIAAIGVILHCLTGLFLAKSFPQRGLTSTELANGVPSTPDSVKETVSPELLMGLAPWPQSR